MSYDAWRINWPTVQGTQQDPSDTTAVWLEQEKGSRNQDCLEYSKQDQESKEL